MASPAVRNVVATIAGIVVAVTVVFVVEGIGHAIFPPPEGLDLTVAEDRERLMDLVPTGAKAAVVAAWFLGALAGACTAIAASGRILMAWIVGVVIALAGLWTTQMFPHPDWMLASAAVLPLVAVLVAKRLMASRIVAA
ncbi:hypothetical protein [Pelagerythrobacter marensis]|uniref:Uncharacterized protein n=1 Tax=Pelagerythrobacter marensis TaxID=543877 RepID=A0A0G3X7U3_9SPHN|nr:hypothetical protein [Pelagerythrobacter marensis]AKM06669.1 hypothetical protein AM2010_583 [Pelagerythrobacter marensis]